MFLVPGPQSTLHSLSGVAGGAGSSHAICSVSMTWPHLMNFFKTNGVLHGFIGQVSRSTVVSGSIGANTSVRSFSPWHSLHLFAHSAFMLELIRVR